jgi:hypothetical protein
VVIRAFSAIGRTLIGKRCTAMRGQKTMSKGLATRECSRRQCADVRVGVRAARACG